jgi:phage terminase Nu1 subunit (DNA packaging protein)
MAKLLCVSERRVQQLAKEGIIPKAKQGQYELLPSVQGYIKYLQNLNKEHSPEGGKTKADLYAAQVRMTEAKAKREELRTAQIEGLLVPVSEVEDMWLTLMANLKSKVNSISQDWSHKLLGIDSLKEMRQQLKNMAHEVLDELSKTTI